MNAQLIIARFLKDKNLDGLADDIARGWKHVVAEAIDEALEKRSDDAVADLARYFNCNVEDLATVMAAPVMRWLEDRSVKCACGTIFLQGSTNHADHILECEEWHWENSQYPDEDLAPWVYQPLYEIASPLYDDRDKLIPLYVHPLDVAESAKELT